MVVGGNEIPFCSVFVHFRSFYVVPLFYFHFRAFFSYSLIEPSAILRH